ncbi:Ankyrin repeat-containing protein [Duganella sp. CF402]|uniref:ankyrin repeat domain-containing protein n=1 Tax=unclassified Duganella TaxID=2636909 RepID=UPI0008CC9989|nr:MULTISPECIES: ankyrin repeat domain-containing protein [unclassified Duganella]RZT10120.1 ankyrin repeat protein [Duganella sp. BK701]SEL27534.1 Ankyrin repeat-containing protein [Duganella sp. CF402]
MTFIFLSDPYRWNKALYRFREKFGRAIRHRIFSAIEHRSDQEVLNLASKRVLTRAKDEWGSSPLVAAIAMNRPTLVSEFIQRGGMFAGDGALAQAAMRGNIDAVEMLLDAGKDPNEVLDEDAEHCRGYTPLMWAVNRKYIPIVAALLKAGADVNAVAADGSTAVMFTRDADPFSLESLDLLCSYNADLTIKDSRGRNIIREARDRWICSEKPEMLEIIKRHHPNTNFDSV